MAHGCAILGQILVENLESLKKKEKKKNLMSFKKEFWNKNGFY
jgi:hypothetical protein